MSKQEPVAWVSDLEMLRKFPDTRTVTLYPMQVKYTSPLYPHQQRRLKRLSEDEIKSIIEMYSCWALDGKVIYSEDIMEFTNAIMDAMMSNNDNTDDEQ